MIGQVGEAVLMMDQHIKVAIGFATGRRSFQNVLRAYLFHLEESHILDGGRVGLNLFVAFDPVYEGTVRADYEQVEPRVRRLFDEVFFYSPEDIAAETERLVAKGAAPREEAALLLGNGYAAQRNMILYQAMRRGMDYLIFFDDDEYPMAVTNSNSSGVALWSGQQVIEAHIKYLQFSDLTNGYHCGYVSPMPSLDLDGILDGETFRRFVSAMSSDVLKWDQVLEIMGNGGITYADKAVLTANAPVLVEEALGAKFITGGNLGLNLTDRAKVVPFYNPPGARGEDSFLSTCLSAHTVKRIPAYTFHDGFAMYSNLLRGVLPTNLKAVTLYDSRAVAQRFLRACIGWVRYKPLYTRITQPQDWTAVLAEAETDLEETLPKVCAYFNDQSFAAILDQLRSYIRDVDQHLAQFERVQALWERLKEE